MNKAIAELSADSAVLISEISKLEKGGTITFDEITKFIGWDIRGNRGIMTTVKRRLLADHGKVLDSIRNVGYRILTDTEIVEGSLSRDRHHRRRSARRSKAKASVVEISSLSETQKIGYLAEITAAHVTIEASGDKSMRQIESKLNGASTPLALSMALDALKPNLK